MGWELVGQGWTLSNTSRGVNLDLEGPQKVAPEAPDTPKMAIFGAFGALVPLYGGPKGPKDLPECVWKFPTWCHFMGAQKQSGHWGFIKYWPPKKIKYGPNYLKYRPHSTISTSKFLNKPVFTLFTFKSWYKHILRKWGVLWNMRNKWGPFQLSTFTKALHMDHTALCTPFIQTIIDISIKVSENALTWLSKQPQMLILFIVGDSGLHHKFQQYSCSYHHLAAECCTFHCLLNQHKKPKCCIIFSKGCCCLLLFLIGTKANNCSYTIKA